ncbi:MAG: amino acid ABC transporter permease [Lactobacillus sp.]|nr:amino acid ABC transporter permease [Lactobacillus sp.]
MWQAYSWINLDFILKGFLVTIEVSVISIILSFLIGAVLGTLRFSKIPVLTPIIAVVVDLVRNLPLLLMIFFTYFGLPELGIKIGSFGAAVLALVIFESAMISEIVRGGIKAIDPGQMEGARSNGMSFFQAMIYVVLPQALYHMIPALLSQFVSLVKDTSLATIILLPDLLYRAQIVYSQNPAYTIPMYILISILYFIICFTLSQLANRISKRYA